MCLFISACERKPHVPPLNLLAQEAKFSIGGRQLQIPLVAITSFGRLTVAKACKAEGILRACGVSLLEASKHSTLPVSVVSISIKLQDYSTYQDAYTDQYVDLSKICPMLSREWSKQICYGKLKPYTDNGLAIRRFTLVENDAFNALDSHSIGGYKESLPSVLKKIALVVMSQIFTVSQCSMIALLR